MRALRFDIKYLGVNRDGRWVNNLLRWVLVVGFLGLR